MWRGADRPAMRVPRVAGDRRDRVPPRPWRGRSAAVLDRRSLRRLPGGAGAVTGHGPPAARHRRDPRRDAGAGAASWRATIRACACSRASSSRSRCCTATVPPSIDVRDGRVELPGRSRIGARRPGSSSISARIARLRHATHAGGCSTPSATTAASRSRSRRRCDDVLAIDISDDAVAHIRANAGAERTVERAGARHERVRRTARTGTARRAVRHHRARSSRVREEQGRRAEGAVRLQGNQPARAEAPPRRAASS